MEFRSSGVQTNLLGGIAYLITLKPHNLRTSKGVVQTNLWDVYILCYRPLLTPSSNFLL